MTTKDDLKLRIVRKDEVGQFNELLSYVFQITGNDIEQSGYENKGELLNSKLPILDHSNVYGWFDEDKLVSQIAIYPCLVNIHGKIMRMGGVTGVGTYPEYAGLSLMRHLILQALEDMRENNQLISYLYPYDISYYRRKGWEIISNVINYKIKDTQLPKTIDVDGYVERTDVLDDIVVSFYDKFAKENHGCLIRNEFNWQEYWRFENEDDYTAAVYYDKNDEAQGVLFYIVKDDIFVVKELIYLTNDAYNGLWNFIAAHFSMIYYVEGKTYNNETLAFKLDDGHIKEWITPYYMARIVDVRKFLEQFPFCKGNDALHFKVSDDIASWNNDIFSIEWNEQGNHIIGNSVTNNEVIIDIQTLTTMLMNYRRPSYLNKIDRIRVNQQTLSILEDICPNNEMYFSDYF